MALRAPIRCLAAGLPAALVLLPAMAARYTVTDLGNGYYPNAVSPSGEIAAIDSHDGRAVVYRGGRWKVLDKLEGNAFGIDQEGDVVGVSGTQAMLWQRGRPGVRVPLPPGAKNGEAYGIDGSRTIVGQYYAGAQFHCFAWHPGQDPVDLGFMESGSYCTALAINPSGVVIGNATVAPGSRVHAFAYADHAFTDLGVLPRGGWSEAAAINAKGDVVGAASVPSGFNHYHAVGWHDGALLDLDPRGLYPRSMALAINDRGLVVGYATSHRRTVAMRFGPGRLTPLGSEVVDLEDWQLVRATAVNNDGVIVGYGQRSDGFVHGFLLTPVGQP